jgi:FAD/FMN-containing dehydrogenase
LRVAVRGGGHNVAGNAVCDGGLVLDMSGMKDIRVDRTARTARADPGLTWGEFDRATQAHGLATTGGFISTTGIAGLTRGGGAGRGAAARLRGAAPAVDIRPQPYLELQGLSDAGFPSGLLHYWKSAFLAELSDDAIEAIVDAAAGAPSPRSFSVIEHLGGAVARVDPDATAFAHRGRRFNLSILSIWEAAPATDTNVAWAHRFWRAVQPFAADAVYVNYLGDEGQERVVAAYDPAKYERLAALKARYDPTNFFRLNQNIRPSPPPPVEAQKTGQMRGSPSAASRHRV